MQVSEKVKSEYYADIVHKNLVIDFPESGLRFTNRLIEGESLRLKETIMDGDAVEFVGCIPSYCSITLRGLDTDIVGERYTVTIWTDGTEDEPIPIFHGIVDSVTNQGIKGSKEVSGYDVLYTKGIIDVSEWYNKLNFPLSIADIRNSLMTYLGIAQETATLPNDGIMISKQYSPTSMKALDVVKSVCQINGVCGIINRQDKFEYRALKNLEDHEGAYLPAFLPLFLGIDQSGGITEPTEYVGTYRKLEYEGYSVKPVDKLVIRQSESDTGVSYGEGNNRYIIQGNMFTEGLSTETLLQMAENIYPYISGISYHPFLSNNNGLPYLECGKDVVSYMVLNEKGDFVEREFHVFSRELSGLQALHDKYSAEGEEYQNEFVTDLKAQFEELKRKVGSQAQGNTYTKDEIDKMFAEKWVSVQTEPPETERKAGTWYVIQGEVVVN
ncbi:MAG: hypothetical protein NC092_00910 [Butyrivibrio sp.]|nr:hypothetical protein [Muribaculum sp.]MCM1551232.1 hypothetical protein [Butyrivibrio sp.]